MVIFCADDARQCGCGQRGHLEAYASATALAERAGEALRAGRASSLGQRLSGGQALTAELVAAEAAAGDPLAGELVMDTARYLALGIVSVMHTVDPNGVLLGGEMTFGGPDVGVGPPLLGLRAGRGRRGGPSPCWPIARRSSLPPWAAMPPRWAPPAWPGWRAKPPCRVGRAAPREAWSRAPPQMANLRFGGARWLDPPYTFA